MTEVVTYKLIVDVEDDATEAQVEAAAEEDFVQGRYDTIGQSQREVIGMEKITSSADDEEEERCAYCNEVKDETANSTHQQWECCACGSWNDNKE